MTIKLFVLFMVVPGIYPLTGSNMKTIKVLLITIIAACAFTVANAQVRLPPPPPHPPGLPPVHLRVRRPPPPPVVHYRTRHYYHHRVIVRRPRRRY